MQEHGVTVHGCNCACPLPFSVSAPQNDQSWFLERNRSAVTAFTSSSVSFANTVQALQVVRPKGCWGTVVYL